MSRRERRRAPADGGRSGRHAALFLWPALLLLAVYVAYPLVFSFGRSMFDGSGSRFVGLGNYVDAFSDDRTLTALRNNAIWVLVAPTAVTVLGLVFAVLTEKIRWATAFRLVLFMPMAISLFASGVIFRLVYDENPDLGVVNAATVTVHDMFTSASPYPGAKPRPNGPLTVATDGYGTRGSLSPGDTVLLPLVGIPAAHLPGDATPAVRPPARPGQLNGVAWLDTVPKGRAGTTDPGERGMPGLAVEALRDGRVVATTTTDGGGRFTFVDLAPGRYSVHLPGTDFTAPFRGLTWLGPGLVTPVIMSAWIWIMTGFAMTFIAAGLSAIPRDALEAARVDGGTEWQVFRRVTVPLLAPVLLVVFVTLVINVLKIFELVYVVAPGSVQAQANVLALQMWQVSFGAGGNQGVGSALGIVLFLLVVPAMALNVRRFRKERAQ